MLYWYCFTEDFGVAAAGGETMRHACQDLWSCIARAKSGEQRNTIGSWEAGGKDATKTVKKTGRGERR